MDALHAINVFFAGLLCGGLLLTQVGILYSMRRMPDSAAVWLHQLAGPSIDRFMPASAIIATGTAIALLVKDAAKPGLIWIGIGGYLAVILISTFLNMPINLKLYRRDKGDPPPDYHALRDRWAIFQASRLTASLIGFACFAVAAVAD